MKLINKISNKLLKKIKKYVNIKNDTFNKDFYIVRIFDWKDAIAVRAERVTDIVCKAEKFSTR